jgi:hypothetical protein
MLRLGWSFFGLSLNNKKNLMDEFYYLTKYGNFSYSDILIIPTFERRYFMDKLYSEYEKK